MIFSSPIFFLTLLGLIPLAAVYFLKVRPRRKTTTAIFLWRQIYTEKRTSSLFQRLRDVLSLLLMILVFVLLTLALTGPAFSGDERKDLLILIDNSASMSAVDSGSMRLESAQAKARDIVTAFNGNQRAAVAAVSDSLRYMCHTTDNPRELVSAIDSIEPTDMSFDYGAISSLVLDGKWAEQYRIILLSDGCGLESQLPEKIELFKIGTECGNAGIVGCDLQRLPAGSRLGFYFQVASSFDEPVETELALTFGDSQDVIKLIPLTIEPGINKPQVYQIDDAGAGTYQARLEIDDALDKDDAAFMALAPKRPIDVSVMAEDSIFFEAGIEAFAQAGGLFRLVRDSANVALAGGLVPETPSAVIFAPKGDSDLWLEIGEQIEAAVPRVLIEDHPAIRHYDAGSIIYAGARKLKPAEDALVLVESEDHVPLIYSLKRDDGQVLVVNMDLREADFYLSAWFPVMVHNMVTCLVGRDVEPPASYRPGQTVPVAVTSGQVSVSLPGSESRQPLSGDSFGPVDKLGFYSLHVGDSRRNIGCSLLDARETLLNNTAIIDTAGPISSGMSPAAWLTIAAILLLIIESVLYHRRKVG